MSVQRWALAAGVVFALSVALSFVHPLGNPRGAATPNGAILPGAQLPFEVSKIIANKCVDCHSEQTRWPFYSRLAPASWLLEHDVAEARSHWNVSAWNAYRSEEKDQLLARLGFRARTRSVPPSRYTLLHPESQLTARESSVLYNWAKGEGRRLRSTASQTARTYEDAK